jgi:hypothetical protein
MNIESREITYRSIVEQIFFEDGTELVVTTGWAEGGGDVDVKLDWVEGEEPEWAKEYVHDVD